MAYAFKNQFGAQKEMGNPLHRGPTMDTRYLDGHDGGGEYRRVSQQASHFMPKSPTDSAIESMNNPRLSFNTATLQPGASMRAMSLPDQNPLLSSPTRMVPAGPRVSRSRPPSMDASVLQQRRLSSLGSPLSSSMNTSGETCTQVQVLKLYIEVSVP